MPKGRRKLLLVLQGMDTSGKDGTVRWVFSRTSPLGVRVTAFKAPSDEERARDYLWRCHAGSAAHTARSWCGPQPLRGRAGAGGRRLDRQGRDEAPLRADQRLRAPARRDRHGGRQVHALHIDKEERQRERLQARIDTPGKQWKFSMADLEVRNTKWERLPAAPTARRCAPPPATHAPWHVIPGQPASGTAT